MTSLNKLKFAISLQTVTIDIILNSFYIVVRDLRNAQGSRDKDVFADFFKTGDFIIIDIVDDITDEKEGYYRHSMTYGITPKTSICDIFNYKNIKATHSMSFIVRKDQPIFVIDRNHTVKVIPKYKLIHKIKRGWISNDCERYGDDNLCDYVFRPRNIYKFQNQSDNVSESILTKYYKVNNFCELVFNRIINGLYNEYKK